MKTTKIAVNLGHNGFVAIEAEVTSILGIEVGIHKTINKPKGWSVTELSTGIALAKSDTSRVAVIALANVRIAKATVESVKAKLAALPLAPAVETLEIYTVPVKVKVEKVDLDSIVAAVHNAVSLTEAERAGVILALNSRTGQLKAKSPSAFGTPVEKLACAAWQAIQPNAFKVSVGTCLFLRGEARDLFDRLSKVRWPDCFDKDKQALKTQGAW